MINVLQQQLLYFFTWTSNQVLHLNILSSVFFSTSGLQRSIAIKNKLSDKFIKSTNPIIKEKLHNDYKSYRNMISTLLKQSKKNYYDKYFKDNINNMKNTWEGIRSIISLQKTTNDSPTIISLEGQTVTDPRTIANT